jgi:Holliday junction resolvase RusA-like endonuclease
MTEDRPQPIAAIRFTVRDPIATNRVYRRRKRIDDARGSFGGSVGMFVTKDGKAYRARVAGAAREARHACPTWPAYTWRVTHVRMSYQLYDYRGDTDGIRKALRDACEGILYENDRIVADGEAPLPIRDRAGRRVEVLVELLGIRSPEDARRAHVAADAAALKRMVAAAKRARDADASSAAAGSVAPTASDALAELFPPRGASRRRR